MSTIEKRMPLIQVVDDRKPDIAGEGVAEGMMIFLQELGSLPITQRIGLEVRVARRPLSSTQFIDITRGESFRNSGNRTITGGRYLMRDHRVGGRIVGALNYTRIDRGSKAPQVIVSNIVVDKNWRRQGVASRLLEELLEEFPQARVDTAMTIDGAAFFGYSHLLAKASNDSAAAPRFRA